MPKLLVIGGAMFGLALEVERLLSERKRLEDRMLARYPEQGPFLWFLVTAVVHSHPLNLQQAFDTVSHAKRWWDQLQRLQYPPPELRAEELKRSLPPKPPKTRRKRRGRDQNAHKTGIKPGKMINRPPNRHGNRKR